MTNHIEALRGLVAEFEAARDSKPNARGVIAFRVMEVLPKCLAALSAQAEAQASGEVDVTGFGTPPLMHDERADAEKLYSLTAFDYAAAPIGSSDWTIYWRGWWHRSLVYGDTTPPPGAVPEEPDPALLASMACCLDHGFGLLSADRQQSMLHDMRKLWDEVMGRGYYRPENRERYTAMLAAAPGPKEGA